MMKRALVAAVAVAALATGGSASAATFKGVVVGNAHGVVLVASPAGTVRAVTGHASLGARIALDGARLTVIGHAKRAMIHGIVVKRRGNLLFLSASSHVVVIRQLRHTASASDTAPQPGSVVDETVGFDDQGDLDQEDEQPVGSAS